MTKKRAAMRNHKCPESGGFVYFVKTIDGTHAKIGYSTVPGERMTELRLDAQQRGLNADLVFVGCIRAYPQQEREIQDMLGIRRIEGSRDWYLNDPKIEALILEHFPVLLTQEEAKEISDNYHWFGRPACKCNGCVAASKEQVWIDKERRINPLDAKLAGIAA